MLYTFCIQNFLTVKKETKKMWVKLMLLCLSISHITGTDNSDSDNDWELIAVQIDESAKPNLHEYAMKHDCEYLRQVGSLDYHLFRRKRGHHSNRSARHVHQSILFDSMTLWAEIQRPKIRRKRGSKGHGSSRLTDSNVTINSSVNLPWPDPLYKEQWHLHNEHAPKGDMRIEQAWNLGYSGKGVVVSILDDGIRYSNPDLKPNYDPLASTDINDHDDDPTPKFDEFNSHGTRCAGEVSAIAGQYCGVGVAYSSKIGGVRMLDGDVNDAVEGAALSFNQHHIDIYSASWGPGDDGDIVDGPAVMAKAAFKKGAEEGRGGKGNIFIWASGDGGKYYDSCSCDGYMTSIYTLGISALTYDHRKPFYLEECPATLATAYSSAEEYGSFNIITTDQEGCAKKHSGTSASAPIAAGVVAMALEANPKLTWRDVQHLIVRTSNYETLIAANNDGEWTKNGVGRKISSKFGYGLMNAERMTSLGKKWVTVPQLQNCTLSSDLISDFIDKRSTLSYTINVKECGGVDDAKGSILYLENVQVFMNATLSKRGDLKVSLRSPMGTRVVLLQPRPRDHDDTVGFGAWPFRSVLHFGENPIGYWTLTVENVGWQHTGYFNHWSLHLFGTRKPAQRGDPINKPIFHMNCHNQCHTTGCSAWNSSEHCLNCANFKKILSDGKTDCVPHCNVGQYTNVEKICKSCLDHCDSCTDSSSCDSCAPGTFRILQDVKPNLHINYSGPHVVECITECPDGYTNETKDGSGFCTPVPTFFTRRVKIVGTVITVLLVGVVFSCCLMCLLNYRDNRRFDNITTSSKNIYTDLPVDFDFIPTTVTSTMNRLVDKTTKRIGRRKHQKKRYTMNKYGSLETLISTDNDTDNDKGQEADISSDQNDSDNQVVFDKTARNNDNRVIFDQAARKSSDNRITDKSTSNHSKVSPRKHDSTPCDLQV